MDTSDLSPARRVAALIAAHLPEGEEVACPEVARRVAVDLMAMPDLLLAYLQSRLDDLVYNAVQVRLAQTRRATHATLLASSGGARDETVSAGVRAAKRQFDWLQWLEHARDRHIPLGQMRRADLYAAAAERTTRGHQELERGALWSALAAGLPDDRATVAEVYTNDAIDALARGITVRSAWDVVGGPAEVAGANAAAE